LKRRDFLINSAVLASAATLPSCANGKVVKNTRLRTAHIGVGGMGLKDLMAMVSHSSVDVAAIFDIDFINLNTAHVLFPED